MNNVQWTQWIDDKKLRWRESFVPPEGSETLARYCGSEQRVEVDNDGHIVRGFVGITTGWKPSFILLRTKRSIGSWILLGANTKVLKVLKY